MTLTVTTNGETRTLTDVALVRAYLTEHGWAKLVPRDEWIAYWVDKGLSLTEIAQIAYGKTPPD